MNNCQADAHALQMWLVSNQFALQSMMTYPPGFQGPVAMPYLIGQSSFPGPASNLPNRGSFVGGKKEKRKNKETSSGNPENVVNVTAIQDVVKTEIPGDAVKTEEAAVVNNLHPAFTHNKMPEVSRLPAVFARNMCRMCGKFFRSGQLLRQHMLVHTDQRKYQCRYCDRAFKQLSHLQQHHRIHTGEKPYKCQIAGCNRSFPQLSNLQHHYRNHDKPDPPSDRTCMFCDRTYCSEVVLRNHVMKIHLANKNDPKLTQLAKDIQELEKLDKSPDTNSHPMNLTSKVVDLTKDIDTNASNYLPLNQNSNSVGEMEERFDDFSESPPQKVRKKSVEETQTQDDVTGLSKSAVPGLIPLERLTKVSRKLDSVTNTSLPNTERIFPTATEVIQTNLVHESEDVSNNHLSKDENVDESNVKEAVCHRNAEACEQNMRSEEYTKSLTQDLMLNKLNNMYDSMMEEMSRKVAQSTDAGIGYNYILDNVDGTAEIVDSANAFNDSLAENNITDDVTTTPYNGVQLNQKVQKSFPVDLQSQTDESNTMPITLENKCSKANCAPRHIAKEETSVYTEVSFVATGKTEVNVHGDAFKPQEISVNSESALNEKEIFVSSSHKLPGSVSVKDSLGRAKRRKSFVPQRVLVPDFM